MTPEIYDRPMWPPRAEIEAQAWDAFGLWLDQQCEAVCEMDVLEQAQLYADETEVRRIAGMTDEEVNEYVRAGGRDPRQVVEEFNTNIERAKADALIRMKQRSE